MALRVLLADESSTIKKVFQLALQDFAVDVRPVNVGIDVVTVAQNFKPDIIFADVLLQKKNGYDVAAEIKQNAALNGIPVVLMWSGFMELDEDKFQASLANAQLEKPFDVAALRKLVTDLVPRTQNQRLSQFLSFPKLPEFEDQKTAVAVSPPPPVEEEFQQVSIPKMKAQPPAPPTVDKYRLNLRPEELEQDDAPVEYNAEAVDVESIFSSADEEDLDGEEFTVREPARPSTPTPAPPPLARKAQAPAPRPPPPPVELELETDDFGNVDLQAPKPSTSVAGLSAAQVEQILRAQSAEVIESVVWKVVPELAAQMIERELNRLLKERDSQPY